MSRNRRRRAPTPLSEPVQIVKAADPVEAICIRSYAPCEASGYGRAASSLRNALGAIGVPRDESAPTVLHVGNPQAWRPIEGRRNVGFAWWPFSTLGNAAAPSLYGIDLLIVPSTWCADGVRMPKPNQRLAVVPLGVDTAMFQPAQRERGDNLRLLFFDSRADEYRAGADLAMRAFKDAFAGREDVALDIWSRDPVNIDKADARIQLRRNVGDDAGLARVYRQYDALIFSSRGEGVGFVALEAMATALPVIHSGQTAMADFADVGQLVGSRKVRVPQPIHPLAETLEPWLDLLTDRLRQFDAQYDKWQAKAHADAEIVRSKWTWERSARRLLEVLEGRDVPNEPAGVHSAGDVQRDAA